MGEYALQKDELTTNILKMRNGAAEQMALITYYGLSGYFKSLMAFGRKSKVTKDNLNVIKEMHRILKKERSLLDFILRNIDKVDVDAATDVVDTLDDLNDKTVTYYYNVMDDIDDACEVKEENRGIRPKKNFLTLTESSSYANQVVALMENESNLKSFLGYEDEFWEFIRPYKKSINVRLDEMAGMFYAIPIYNPDDTVATISLLVPEVVSLDSALLAIKIYEEAYRIYKHLNKPYKSSKSEDMTLRLKYENDYLSSKAVRVLN